MYIYNIYTTYIQHMYIYIYTSIHQYINTSYIHICIYTTYIQHIYIYNIYTTYIYSIGTYIHIYIFTSIQIYIFKSSTHSFHLTGVMWPCVSFRCGDRRRHSWLRRDKGAVLAVFGSRRDPWAWAI